MRIEFRVDESYAKTPRRPVLGQWFEDHPRGIQAGERPGDLPAFFSNLIPEGDLGLILRERLALEPWDDFGLLVAVGQDLPGAVVVTQLDGDPPLDFAAEHPYEQGGIITPRFSLAGVQLKFSMTRHGDRFYIPGRDRRGHWIAKLALEPYQGLCENEWATMEWARRCGFDVPQCELHKLGDLIDVPHTGDPQTPVYVIQRFDRDGPRRVHQEDFQQVLGRVPRSKYDDLTYEGLVKLIMVIVGDSTYDEAVRRLVFMVASGNGDAHLKNWTLVYPDGVHPRLSPLYDQVFTAQWSSFRELALNLGGTKDYGALEMGRFRELARRVGRDPGKTERLVAETVDTAANAWQLVRELPAVTREYHTEIDAHWRRVPILRPLAERMTRRLV